MRKLSLFALAVAALGITSSANASTAMLATDDFVGIYLAGINGMIATTVFFFAERNTVAAYGEHQFQ